MCLEQCWTVVTAAIVWSLSQSPPRTSHSNCVSLWVSGDGEATNPVSGTPEVTSALWQFHSANVNLGYKRELGEEGQRQQLALILFEGLGIGVSRG